MPPYWTVLSPVRGADDGLWATSAVNHGHYRQAQPFLEAFAPTEALALVELAWLITETIEGRVPK